MYIVVATSCDSSFDSLLEEKKIGQSSGEVNRSQSLKTL